MIDILTYFIDMATNERLKELRIFLKLTQREMANILAIKQNSYSYIETGKASITDRNKETLVREFGVSLDWLNEKEGAKMFNSGKFVSNYNKSKDRAAQIIKRTIEDDSMENVNSNNNNLQYPVKPFIDSVYAVCGTPSGFSMAIKEAECEGLSLPFMKEYDFSIRAKGDSMINRSNPARSICESDIVVCRLWKSRSHVRWGEVYALATTEGVVIKKLQESEKVGHIKCVSFNIEDGFTPYDLPVEEIFDWAIVTGVVSARNWN